MTLTDQTKYNIHHRFTRHSPAISSATIPAPPNYTNRLVFGGGRPKDGSRNGYNKEVKGEVT